MKVLCILSQDDANEGVVTAVLEMVEGENDDDLFVKWLKQNSRYFSDKSRNECLEAPYAWNVNETEKI